MPAKALSRDGSVIEESRITKLLASRRPGRVPRGRSRSGRHRFVAGFTTASVADTIAAMDAANPLPAMPVDPPTLAMTFSINDSPLAGKEGDKVATAVNSPPRLAREQEGNVAIRIRESDDKDAFEVAGRGELQLGVLIETMRREGYELSVGRPRVLLRTDANGNREEPMEDVMVDADEAYPAPW